MKMVSYFLVNSFTIRNCKGIQTFNKVKTGNNNLYAVVSKKYRYQAIKQKEQSKLKIQKTRQSHEIRRHK